MPLWVLIILVIALIAIRQYQVKGAMRKQEPGILALVDAAPILRLLLGAVSYAIRTQVITESERKEWLADIDFSEAALLKLLASQIDDGAKVYLSGFARWVPLARDFIQGAPYVLDNAADDERFVPLYKRKKVLEAHAVDLIEANPERSFVGMIILGVPRVKDVPMRSSEHTI